MPFTEFCCCSGGSNLNAGTRTGDTTEPGVAADLTYTGGTWVNATGVFTVASGNPASDGVVAGDFASVYTAAAATTGFVGRVTAADATTITVSITAKAGTVPADGTRTLKIGGAWQGPNGAVPFPWNFVVKELVAASPSGGVPRVNYKNDQTYAVTATLSQAATLTTHQGYGTSYGDGGRALFDGGTSGASYIVLNAAGNSHLEDFEVQNNGATGTSAAVVLPSDGIVCKRVVVHDVRGQGINASGNNLIIECEVYNSCQANTGAAIRGIVIQNGQAIRCISHHNSGSLVSGFATSGGTFIQCIAAENGLHGFTNTTGVSMDLHGCDAYANAGNGANIIGTGVLTAKNANFVANGGWGISGDSAQKVGILENCGFGSGTMANVSGAIDNATIDDQGIILSGAVTYPADVTPWTDPDNGNFVINLPEAINTGRGQFLITMTGYGDGTDSYPDIGACQHFGCLPPAVSQYADFPKNMMSQPENPVPDPQPPIR